MALTAYGLHDQIPRINSAVEHTPPLRLKKMPRTLLGLFSKSFAALFFSQASGSTWLVRAGLSGGFGLSWSFQLKGFTGGVHANSYPYVSPLQRSSVASLVAANPASSMLVDLHTLYDESSNNANLCAVLLDDLHGHVAPAA